MQPFYFVSSTTAKLSQRTNNLLKMGKERHKQDSMEGKLTFTWKGEWSSLRQIQDFPQKEILDKLSHIDKWQEKPPNANHDVQIHTDVKMF